MNVWIYRRPLKWINGKMNAPIGTDEITSQQLPFKKIKEHIRKNKEDDQYKNSTKSHVHVDQIDDKIIMMMIMTIQIIGNEGCLQILDHSCQLRHQNAVLQNRG